MRKDRRSDGPWKRCGSVEQVRDFGWDAALAQERTVLGGEREVEIEHVACDAVAGLGDAGAFHEERELAPHDIGFGADRRQVRKSALGGSAVRPDGHESARRTVARHLQVAFFAVVFADVDAVVIDLDGEDAVILGLTGDGRAGRLVLERQAERDDPFEIGVGLGALRGQDVGIGRGAAQEEKRQEEQPSCNRDEEQDRQDGMLGSPIVHSAKRCIHRSSSNVQRCLGSGAAAAILSSSSRSQWTSSPGCLRPSVSAAFAASPNVIGESFGAGI